MILKNNINALIVLNHKWLLLSVIFTITVIILTHIPQGMVPVVFGRRGFDKVLHIVAYCIISCLFIMTFHAFNNLKFNLILLLIIIVLGAADELTQEITGRNPSIFDWMSDIMGGLIAQYIFFFHNRIKLLSMR